MSDTMYATVFRLMMDNKWRTLKEICALTNQPDEGAVSSRLRDMRKAKYGCHTVTRRSSPRGDEYQLIVNDEVHEDAKHLTPKLEEPPSAKAQPLHIDFETRSVIDLRKHGVYVYAVHESTDLWCAAYAFGDGPIHTWVPGKPCPHEIIEHVQNGGAIWAHNATFERLIWTHVLGPRHGWPVPQRKAFHCTMARSYAQALPGALDGASNAVGLDLAKDGEGYRLMLLMSKPRRFDLLGNPVWWDDDPARLQRLIKYCIQDVVVERALDKRLFHLTAQEHRIWTLDQEINDRGLLVDRQLCEIARDMIEVALKQLNKDIRLASGNEVLTTSSVQQIINFCNKCGLRMRNKKGEDELLDSIRAENLELILAMDDLPKDVRAVLEIRQEASKVSVKKIQALLTDANKDGRVRGLLAYHAASTGRWAGRRFQPQNIKRPENKNQKVLVDLVRRKQMGAIDLLGGPISVISDIIRGMIVAAKGKHLFAADFANIEGRGLAWLVGEQWKLKAFEAYDNGLGPDIYKLAYSRAFHTLIENITDDMRQVGKVMELALGYQGGVGAFQSMAAVYGVKVSNERADELKLGWRSAHPQTVSFWWDIERAAMLAVQHPTKIVECGKLKFRTRGSFLYMQLPSGRCLTYPYPKLMELPTPWGEKKLMLTYKTALNPSNAKRVVHADGNNGHWGRISAYGGLLTENAVQAIARDVMAEAMLRVNAADFPIILTVHDEIVAEAPATHDIKKFKALVEQVPAWATGFPIVAQAWQGDRYKKG